MKKSFVWAISGLACLVILTTSCQKDEEVALEETTITVPTLGKAYPKAEKALWSYLQNFEEEAARRGLNVNLNMTDLTAKIAEIAEEHVAGMCSYGGHIGHNITIDHGFWNSTNSVYFKEMVVFHELGHCYLGRQHLETAFSNNACKSIMRSGIEDCRDNYNASTRSYYLDELFSLLQP